MSYDHENHLNNLDNDLDHSIQQESPRDYKRDSGIDHFQLEQQQMIHHEKIHESDHSNNFMRNSNLQEDNIFSYTDDHRMRQSMKSQEDFELQDVSGNADMSDRKMQLQQKIAKPIAIIQEYHGRKGESEQIVEKQKKLSPQNQQKLLQATEQTQAQQSITFQLVIQNNVKQVHSLSSYIQPQNISSNIQTPKKQLIEKYQSPPQKQKSTQKQQWSFQSNKSYSPKPQEDIYQSPKKQKQDSIKEQKAQQKQKPKISFVKQNFTLIKQSQSTVQSSGSSIRDWFRISSSKQTPTVTPQRKQQGKKTSPKNQQTKLQDAKQKYRKQMQNQMLGFQQNLSKHQKVNKLFGASQKQKQKQKVNKTHFPQPSSKNFASQNQSQQTSKDQYRMLLKISFQKKKQNYQMLKEWDKNRAQNMNVHRNVIEMLQNEVDKRIKLSLENFQIYTNFFRQKVKQQEKFVNSPVINTKYALQNNSISKNIYINCSVILNSLSDQNQAKCKKIHDFVTLIKNNVLKDLADKHLHQSQKQLLKVREKISTLKSTLKKYNSQTEQKSQALAQLFVQSSSNVSIKAQNDFYSAQLQFLRSAAQQILIQKRLGENCLQYYYTALAQEFKRSKVIKQSLLTYSKGLKETYGMELEEVQLEQLSKDQEIKLIEEFYSVEDMFDERSSQILKNKLKILPEDDLRIKNVSQFVESFQFQNFNCRMLTLKEFQAKYYSLGSSSKDAKSPRQETCFMVITVDFYIHLFFSTQKSILNFKPDVSLKIMSKQLEIREQKQQFIDIVKKQQRRGSMISYFWDSKNEKSYRVKFASKDAKQQFCDYVRKLMF